MRWRCLPTFVALAIALPPGYKPLLTIAQAQPKPLGQLSWNRVVQGLKPNKPFPGGQIDVCPISPLQQDRKTAAVIWHERPLFVWRGRIGAIGVREPDTNIILWKESVNATSLLNRRWYDGERLRVGKTYEWLFFANTESQSPLFRIPFQIMTASQGILVQAELLTLQRQLDLHAANREEMALHRANYFAQRQLWSDVLQEVYSVRNPSTPLQQVAQDIATKVCQKN